MTQAGHMSPHRVGSLTQSGSSRHIVGTILVSWSTQSEPGPIQHVRFLVWACLTKTVPSAHRLGPVHTLTHSGPEPGPQKVGLSPANTTQSGPRPVPHRVPDWDCSTPTGPSPHSSGRALDMAHRSSAPCPHILGLSLVHTAWAWAHTKQSGTYTP